MFVYSKTYNKQSQNDRQKQPQNYPGLGP